jgi:hypothetical protein
MVKDLSNTARAVLIVAASREDRLAQLPRLPVAAARQVIRSLLSADLLEEITAPIEDADFAWRDAKDGGALMLRATSAGLARIHDPETSFALPTTVTDDESTETFDTSSGSKTDLRPEPGIAHAGDENEEGADETILVSTNIVPFVNAFVRELMKPARAPFVAKFLRRLDAGSTMLGSTTTKREGGMTPSQRTIIELCSRPDGATGKELAEGCGWPSIAARATCQKLADRFSYDLHESPKANGRGISFRMTAKPAAEGSAS